MVAGMSTRTLRTPPQALIFVFGAITGALIAMAMWLMLIPHDPTPPMFPHQDKVMHFIAFGMITGPAALILPLRYLGFILSAVITLAAGVEYVQTISALGRQGDILDFLAGGLGAIVAAGVGRWIVVKFFPA